MFLTFVAIKSKEKSMRNSPNMKRYLRKCALNVRNVSFLSTFRTFKAHFHCRRNTRDFHNLGRWKDLLISCYLVSYAITSLVLQLLCNGKGTAISWICKRKWQKVEVHTQLSAIYDAIFWLFNLLKCDSTRIWGVAIQIVF